MLFGGQIIPAKIGHCERFSIATNIPLRWSGENQMVIYSYEHTAPLERLLYIPSFITVKMDIECV